VLVLRLLLDPVGSTEEDSTLLGYYDRDHGQELWHRDAGQREFTHFAKFPYSSRVGLGSSAAA
jgi:hypothetical protein